MVLLSSNMCAARNEGAAGGFGLMSRVVRILVRRAEASAASQFCVLIKTLPFAIATSKLRTTMAMPLHSLLLPLSFPTPRTAATAAALILLFVGAQFLCPLLHSLLPLAPPPSNATCHSSHAPIICGSSSHLIIRWSSIIVPMPSTSCGGI